MAILSPIDYFRSFFDNVILDHIVNQSNIYAIQTDPSKPLNLAKYEFEKFLGVVMLMSITVLPRTRYYWSLNFGNDRICNIMSRNRFEQVKRFVHFNDNTAMPVRGEQNFDKLFKVRPLVTHLCQKFNDIPFAQSLCIDEQMIPFKGNSSLKQYIPSKPHKYGYKVFVLSDVKGIVYNFEFYTGKIGLPDSGVDIGASSNIVLRLSQVIPEHKNHILYFDNWFTSLPLVNELSKIKIYCLGTVRANRLHGCTLVPDKELMKRGRGAYEEKEGVMDNTTVRILKWVDNRAVTLLSTFASAKPIGVVKRWDKKEKKKIDVPRPHTVQIYNQCMGGVDLLDSLIGLYRISIRSKKYYHRIFFHLIDMTVVNSWLLYRRDCDELKFPANKQLSLLEFKFAIADALCLAGKPGVVSKRGRPSTSCESQHLEKKRMAITQSLSLRKPLERTILTTFHYIRRNEAGASFPTVRAAHTCSVKSVRYTSVLTRIKIVSCNFIKDNLCRFVKLLSMFIRKKCW